MKKALILLLISMRLMAQECDCGKDFNWIVETWEKNDAGFQYVVDKKGKDEYQKILSVLRSESAKTKSMVTCQKIMWEYLRFFRKGHAGVRANLEQATNSQEQLKPEEIRKKYSAEKKIELDEKQLKALLDKKNGKNPIEGIWVNNYYTLGILQDDKIKNMYNAFIIKADSVYWMPKQVKATFFTTNDPQKFGGTWKMRDHSKDTSWAEFSGDSKNLLKTNNDYYRRLYPKSNADAREDVFYEFISATVPYARKISDKTVYVRIPSFLPENKKKIDSMLEKNHQLITSTENMIIDIRYGTGGGDGSYKELIKYIYTNPIRSVGVQLLGTELNAQAYEKYAAEEDSSNKGEIKRMKDLAKKLRENPGKFVDQGEVIYVDSSFRPLPFPKKVGILVNHNNGSTDEQFLLDAKPSRKVKVFGWTTGGMLDISNVNSLNSPDGKFTLGYCMSKSFRIPHYCIDGVGIQPDYFIDEKIPEMEWIEYTRKTLEE